MSDRINGFVVTLEENVRDDDEPWEVREYPPAPDKLLFGWRRWLGRARVELKRLRKQLNAWKQFSSSSHKRVENAL